MKKIIRNGLIIPGRKKKNSIIIFIFTSTTLKSSKETHLLKRSAWLFSSFFTVVWCSAESVLLPCELFLWKSITFIRHCTFAPTHLFPASILTSSVPFLVLPWNVASSGDIRQRGFVNFRNLDRWVGGIWFTSAIRECIWRNLSLFCIFWWEMSDRGGMAASSLAVTERKPQRPGGYTGIFFQLFDWNRRFAKKKLFSKKLLSPGCLF